jgi:hypothetical protein
MSDNMIYDPFPSCCDLIKLPVPSHEPLYHDIATVILLYYEGVGSGTLTNYYVDRVE